MRKDALRRYFVFRLKLVEMFHFNRLWTALVHEKFVPENAMGHEGEDFALSLRTALLSWFCTVVDRTGGGLNVFDVWSQLFPHERQEIARVRAEVEPHWEILKEFRDKCGFHADTPRNYYRAQLEVLNNTQKVVEAMQSFLELAKRLINLQDAELPDFVPEVESFMLDFELENKEYGFNRESLKRLGILPRITHYKRVFS